MPASPDWSTWSQLRDVELWEAVALSLNMDPAHLPTYLGAFEIGDHDVFRICPEPFKERLQVAVSNAMVSLPAKPVHPLKGRCIVDLPTFGAWAPSQWELPPEFPRAARDQPSVSPLIERASLRPEVTERQEERQARRYKMCLDAGLTMPTNDYASLPRGIGALAKQEGISRQAFAEDVKAYIARLATRAA